MKKIIRVDVEHTESTTTIWPTATNAVQAIASTCSLDSVSATATATTVYGSIGATKTASPASTSIAPPPPPAPSPGDICGDWYQAFDDHFEIRGSNFDAAKLGTDGSGLKKQVGGCGALTSWKFNYTSKDQRFSWFASGKLPIGVKACVGRAVISAEGQRRMVVRALDR